MKILRNRVTAVFEAVDLAESFVLDGKIKLSVCPAPSIWSTF